MPKEPVQPHDHTRFSRGGKLTSLAISGLTTTTTGSGGSGGGGSGTSDHGALGGLGDDDHASYATVTAGGGETLSTVAATGATETVDPATANIHDLTLTADCVLTLTSPTSGVGCGITIVLRQDGTGSRTVTWPGSVVWPDGVTPTLSTAASAVDVFTLFTIDGGTTWYGFQAGSGGSSSSSGVGEILIVDSGASTPLIFADLVQNDDQTDLVYADP